eukprot:45754-Amphidinium_carterae.1
MHSKNSRRAHSRVHTNALELADLAVWPMARAAPAFLPDKSGANLRGNEKQVVEQDEGQQHQEKRRRGGGGAWRAFVHHRSKKRKWDATTPKSLAEEYHALSPNTRSFYKRLGDDAAALHRQGELTFPHYSQTAAAARSRGAGGAGAEQQKHRNEELAHGFDVDVSKLAEAVFTGQAVPLTSLPTPRRRDIDLLESMIRSYASQIRESKRNAEKKSVEDLGGLFGESEEHAQELLQHRRMLRELHTCTWRNFPSSMPHICHALVAEFEPRSLQKFVEGKHDGGLKHTTTLAEAWKGRHLALQQRTWEHHEKRAPPNRRCFHAGM